MTKHEEYQRLAQLIRGYSVTMTTRTNSSHVGSCLSMAELVAVLYGGIMNLNPKDPMWSDRDRFFLSKGHAAAGVYGALAEKGFFPKEWIATYYRDDGKLSGHASFHVPGVEFSTGSLGHALSVGLGMALVAKRKGKKHRIFVLMSEGDCEEGSTWEAMMFAAQHHLDNVIAIVDANRIQALGNVADIIDLEPFAKKAEAFGWSVRDINGHDVRQIESTLLGVPFESGKPSFVIARTVKCKGIRDMENTLSSHYQHVPQEKLAAVLMELGVKDAFPIQ